MPVIIAGHRDTHFRLLGKLALGDTLVLEDADKNVRKYRVSRALVVNRQDPPLLEPGPPAPLVLITCYPFDALRVGGPRRYLVVAEPVTGVESV